MNDQQTPNPAERPTADELTALYREGSTVEPGLMLDQRILAAAKAELANDQRRARHAQIARPWWKVWLVPATTVAIGVVGISLAWRIVDQQEHDLRAAMNAAETQVQSPTASVGDAVTPALSAPAPVSSFRRVEKEAKSGRPALVAETARAVPEQKHEAEPEAKAAVLARESLRQAPPAAQVAAAPAQSGELAAKKSRTELAQDAAEEDRAAVVGAQSARAPAAAAGATRSDYVAEKAGGAAMEAAAPDDASTPEDWLKHVRALRVAGQEAEAARSLARFRLRYPDYVVPADLNPGK